MNQFRARRVDNVLNILGEGIDRDRVLEALSMPDSGLHYHFYDGWPKNVDYKGLAFVGDATAGKILGMKGYHAGLTPGVMDARRQQILANGNLARICDAMGLTPCIILSPAQNGPISDRVKAGIVEALIAAADISDGLTMAERVMERLGIV